MLLMRAKRGDIILLAGKGHENYQIIGATKTHFSDLETAAELAELIL
jgi:UDP-N-acetylmuramoyl-L-alanyl-D-glutamate--2,6-diaminopimelate ligase